MRLLLAALFLLVPAVRVSAQTGIEALYGTWEITRDTTLTYTSELGDQSYTTLYRTVELSADEIVETVITDQPGFGESTGHGASATRARTTGDGLVRTVNDTLAVRLRLDGERLGMTWDTPDTTYAEALYDRTEAHTVPEALLGTWLVGIVDPAGIAFDVPVQITESGLSAGGEPPVALRVMDGYLLTEEPVTFEDGDPLADMTFYSAAPYRISADGRTLTIDRKPTERWVRPR